MLLLNEVIQMLPEQDSGESTLYESERMVISWALEQHCYARLTFDFQQKCLFFKIDNSLVQGHFPIIDMDKIDASKDSPQWLLFEQFTASLTQWFKAPLVLNTQSLNPDLSDTNNYSLWRLDDNNNHFEMQRNLTLEKAQQQAQVYEQRGHKQVYYIQQTL
jgi:hypothetical protein